MEENRGGMASSQDPVYERLDNEPAIRLQSLYAGTKYERLPGDYDHSHLQTPSEPYRTFDERSNYVQSKPPGRLERLRAATIGRAISDKKYIKYNKYVRFGSTSNEENDRHHKAFRGWRKSVVAAAIVAGTVLTVNVIFLIVAVTRFGAPGGIGVIHTGDCSLVKRWDTALHLLINVLGTALLAASSFTMQCLSSPTRSEADRAHAKRIPMQVGIPSFKNLFNLSKRKALLWWLLALSTMPLHLLWNSTIFTTLGAYDFSYIVVDEKFLDGARWINRTGNNCHGGNTPPFNSVYESYRAGFYSGRLNASDCIKYYSQSLITRRKNMLAITKPTADTRMSPGCDFTNVQTNRTFTFSDGQTNSEMVYLQPLANGSSVLAFEYESSNLATTWLCWGYDSYILDAVDCSEQQALSLLNKNGTWYLRPTDSAAYSDDFTLDAQSYPIEYCLSEDNVPGMCTLQYVPYILSVVVFCNVVKVASMIASSILLWNLDEPILATVGDAVASYMENPDPTTRGWCLMGRAQVEMWSKSKLDPSQSCIYNPKPKVRLFSATSKTRWNITIGLCTLYLLIGVLLLHLAVRQVEGDTRYTLKQVWNLGMGAINSNTLLGFQGQTPTGITLDILIANSFQVALSMTYFLYNSLYTAQCGAIEWAAYVGRRHSLRVTYPRGQQRSTYWLHLPYHYGLPLTAMLMLLHFLISQSIFLARVQWYQSDGSVDPNHFISNVGFSPIAILITVLVGAAIILAQVFHSLRKINGLIPVHGNSTVAISAACHPGSATYENDQSIMVNHPEENMALRRVMWGAVVQARDKSEVGHCSFTADIVDLPIRGRKYQGINPDLRPNQDSIEGKSSSIDHH